MAGDVNLAQRLAAGEFLNAPTAELRAGTINYDQTADAWTVTVGTSVVPAIWGEHITPVQDAPCLVALTTPALGQTVAWVISMTQQYPLESHAGKVLTVPAGSPTISVTVNGKTFTATTIGPYAPAVNDPVLLEQRGGTLYAVGKIGVAPPAKPPASNTTTTAPPPAITKGTSTFRAQDSGTYTAAVGGWNSYFGQKVYSGSGYVPPSTGHWFYGGATKGLADKTTIRAVRFYLGARVAAGAYNSTATVHFYRHSSNVRGGNPALTVGPYNLNVAAGWGGGWITLPTSFGAALKAGGGISIAGDPYVGFLSGASSPASGTLSIDWSK